MKTLGNTQMCVTIHVSLLLNLQCKCRKPKHNNNKKDFSPVWCSKYKRHFFPVYQGLWYLLFVFGSFYPVQTFNVKLFSGLSLYTLNICCPVTPSFFQLCWSCINIAWVQELVKNENLTTADTIREGRFWPPRCHTFKVFKMHLIDIMNATHHMLPLMILSFNL